MFELFVLIIHPDNYHQNLTCVFDDYHLMQSEIAKLKHLYDCCKIYFRIQYLMSL